MSVMSVFKQIKSKTPIPFKTAVPLGLGSVVGGFLSEKLLTFIVNLFNANSIVTVVQNFVLAILILCVFLYMKNKEKFKGKEFEVNPKKFTEIKRTASRKGIIFSCFLICQNCKK